MASGSYLNYNSTYRIYGEGSCYIHNVPDLFSPTARRPSEYAYVAGGVPVSRSAVGIPFKQDSGNNGFTNAFGVYSQGQVNADIYDYDYDDAALDLFQSATICAPVVKSNPVHCRRSGNLSVTKEGINATADGCSVSSPIFSVDPTTSPASSIGVCTDGDQIGKATIVIGSVHDHAFKLAEVMRDILTAPIAAWQIPNYIVACSIDMTDSIDFRTVKYARVSPGTYLDGQGYSFELHSDTNASCLPLQGDEPLTLETLRTDGTLAHGAAASHLLLAENIYRDGWWHNLYLLAVSRVTTDEHLPNISNLVFDNSVNGLEDTLGVVSAAALSMYWSRIYGGEDNWTYWGSGSAEFSGIRVGPGEAWAVVYVLPEVFAIGLLVYLLWKRRGINSII
ncbi:uncharacterized protein KY384_000458 [Bacidia gigantensis]|uniref:uncharacterized protein n=1 Tax=Bacidia gigantensis TaxID=2732470 RepID=UPI001D053293|nr:uncharacterized protein KY384_000458 [Bacidia gigantensis]KAG8525698.1 hypothetical protein KY384_000458 [Bacidia gigantensis]